MAKRKSAKEESKRKIKTRKTLCKKRAKEDGISFVYKLYDTSGEFAIEIKMKGKRQKSHIKSRFPFESEKAAKEFFYLCARCRVTPLNLSYVYSDSVSSCE